MKRQVWKFDLDFTSVDLDSARIPNAPHKILKVSVQNSKLKVWIEVNNSASYKVLYFRQFLTGEEIESDYPLVHLETLLLHDGSFVVHIYQEMR